MRIEDISYPSGAHVKPMYAQFVEDGSMRGIFASAAQVGRDHLGAISVPDCG